MSHCPSCGVQVPEGTLLCVECGYHLKEGKRLSTEGAAPAAIQPAAADNPYQSPASGHKGLFDKGRLKHNYDLPTRVSYVEERVRELERRIDATRLLSPNFLMRLLAVCGYAVLGYILVVATLLCLSLLIRIAAL